MWVWKRPVPFKERVGSDPSHSRSGQIGPTGRFDLSSLQAAVIISLHRLLPAPPLAPNSITHSSHDPSLLLLYLLPLLLESFSIPTLSSYLLLETPDDGVPITISIPTRSLLELILDGLELSSLLEFRSYCRTSGFAKPLMKGEDDDEPKAKPLARRMS